MPDPDRDPRAPLAGTPSDELVLAAVERAGRHSVRGAPGVPIWEILEHLAIAGRRSSRARQVRSRLDVLHAGGWLEHARRHGVPTWELSVAGRRRLERARHTGELALPESPQHRAWLAARILAAQEIERFRASLREQLVQARLLLDAKAPPDSDAWFETGDALQRACWRVGSASHCLHEWPEPDDIRADIDEQREEADEELEPHERARRRARRAGRRNIRLWDEAPRRRGR